MGGVEVPQAPRGVTHGGGGIPLPAGEGSGEGAVPPPRNFFRFFVFFLLEIPNLTHCDTFIS